MPEPKESLVHSPKGEIELLRDSESLQEFLREPAVKVAEILTGVFAAGKSEFILAGGRIVQAAIKHNIYVQVAREIRAFQEKGRIKEDYAKTKYGFQSLKELLEFIDSDAPDEDRLGAAKAMFFAVTKVGVKEGEQLVAYELLRLTRKLSGSQILLLKISFDLYTERVFQTSGLVLELNGWTAAVGARLGHTVAGLIYQDETALINNGLLQARNWGVNVPEKQTARLTDLGIKFCEYIRDYENAKK